jgi:hypothetical protein
VAFFQVDPAVERFHAILEVGTPAVLCLIAFVGMLIKTALADIKLEQAAAKADLLKGQTEMKQEFDAKHAENTKTIEVHSASDEGHFREIAASLQRGEEAFRRIEQRQINGVK